MIRMETIALATGADGAGTVRSTSPLVGEITSVRMAGAGDALCGAAADFTLTRTADGGTILAVTNVAAPWQYATREAVHSTTGGTSAYTLGVGPVFTDGVPIDGYLQVIVANAEADASADLFVFLQ